MALSFLRAKPDKDAAPSSAPPSGQALALIPVMVALLLAALLLPRGVPPEGIPLPQVDTRVLEKTTAADDARAARSHKTPLSPESRAVGSAVRAFNAVEASGEDATAIGQARDDLNRARRVALETGQFEALLDLRALQLSEFLLAVQHFEATGETTRELTELGGTFVQRLTKIGWCVGHRVLMNEPARRVAFKTTWNRMLFLDADPTFAVTLDEQRALYSFYFKHPHASEAQRPLLDALRHGIHDAASAKQADQSERAAIANWLLPKIDELARIDPTYPEPLARGVALYERRDYAAAASTYERWLEAHPSGPWALRAQNHLRASLLADEQRLQ